MGRPGWPALAAAPYGSQTEAGVGPWA